MKQAVILKRRGAKIAYVEAIVGLAHKYPKIATGSGAFGSDISKAELMEALVGVRRAVDAEPDGKRGLQTGKGCSTPPSTYVNDNGFTATNLYQFLVAGVDKSQAIGCYGHYFKQAFDWAIFVIRSNPHAFPAKNAGPIEAEINQAATVIAFGSFGAFCEECFGTTNAHMDGCARA